MRLKKYSLLFLTGGWRISLRPNRFFGSFGWSSVPVRAEYTAPFWAFRLVRGSVAAASTSVTNDTQRATSSKEDAR